MFYNFINKYKTFLLIQKSTYRIKIWWNTLKESRLKISNSKISSIKQLLKAYTLQFNCAFVEAQNRVNKIVENKQEKWIFHKLIKMNNSWFVAHYYICHHWNLTV